MRSPSLGEDPLTASILMHAERQHSMNARNLKPFFLSAIVASSLVAGLARAEGLYAGGSIGVPHFGDVNGVDGGSSGVSGKAFGGYQVNSNFAVEAGIADLGRVSDGTGKIKSHGEYLDAVGLLPLGNDFSLLGSVGLAHVNLDTSNGDARGSGLKLGLGSEYALSHNVALRGEYERYQPAGFGGHPVIGQFTVGVRVGF
jgi:OOP family OmpA-OmpF porin